LRNRSRHCPGEKRSAISLQLLPASGPFHLTPAPGPSLRPFPSHACAGSPPLALSFPAFSLSFPPFPCLSRESGNPVGCASGCCNELDSCFRRNDTRLAGACRSLTLFSGTWQAGHKGKSEFDFLVTLLRTYSTMRLESIHPKTASRRGFSRIERGLIARAVDKPRYHERGIGIQRTRRDPITLIEQSRHRIRKPTYSVKG